MKLKTQFSLIVLATVILVFVLTLSTQVWSKRNMRIKNYQYQQMTVQRDLADLVNFINQVNYHHTLAQNVYRDYNERFDAVENSMKILTTDEIVRSFPKEFNETLSQIGNLWAINRLRYEKLKPYMEAIEKEEMPLVVYTQIQKSGIRDTYRRMPDNEIVQRLYAQVELIDAEFSGILVGSTTMEKLVYQASYEFEDILKAADTRYRCYAIIIAVIISALLGTSITMITFNISRHIVSVRNMSKGLAKKDFTLNIKPQGSGEMQDLMLNMNNMVSELNAFLLVVKKTASRAISSGYQINDSANSTAAATTEIDANIESITKEFDLISASVEKSVSIIGEMNKQVDKLVQNNSLQTKSVEDANRTVIDVAETLEHITQMTEDRARDAQEMHELVADGDQKIKITAQKLDEIKKQLKQISGVVKIINDIASQTNLLSMNAAIEAAHAGEAGMGFSVVAAEIRGLAESTTENAKKIRESVGNIVETVNGANEASIKASEAFGKVRVNADQVIDSMQEISGEIAQVDNQMQSIKSKTEETAVAADEISSFCEQLAGKQRTVSEEVTSMNDLFAQAKGGIHEIKRGTSDIVQRITEVSENSKDSYKNMTDLENVLEEFKTKDDVAEAIAEIDNQNAIENVSAEEIAQQALSMAEEVLVPTSGDEIEFNLEDVEEVEFL
ncbi:MAG: hypothetical protein HUK25_01150 [Treponema sp.]|nr:hypothetical protein [Treponema sp.]